MNEIISDIEQIRNEIISTLDSTSLSPIVPEIAKYVASGKMLRGKLPRYICSTRPSTLSMEEATKIGASIEMVHAASLVHDDIIDNSELRRGMPSFWKAKGVQGAILFGDMLICKSFKLINDTIPCKMSDLINLTTSVCEAEVSQELISKGREITYQESIEIARKKTGSLFAFAASCCGSKDEELSAALKEAGYRLGTAYQLADDVLDAYGSEEVTDKPIGNDKKAGKSTLANMDSVELNIQDEIISLYESYKELLAPWPEVKESWAEYLNNEFKPVIDKFLKNYITDNA